MSTYTSLTYHNHIQHRNLGLFSMVPSGPQTAQMDSKWFAQRDPSGENSGLVRSNFFMNLRISWEAGAKQGELLTIYRYAVCQEASSCVWARDQQTEMTTYPYSTMDHDSAIPRVDMAGICGTDRHIYHGEATELRGQSIFPYVGGHEVIGTIEEIGDNAAKVMEYGRQPLAVGDRVVLAVEVNNWDRRKENR